MDFRGQDPAWPRSADIGLADEAGEHTLWHTDALVLAPPEAVVEDVLDEFIEDTPLPLVIAPDSVGKAGYSGGQLQIWLPGAADPLVVGGPEGETLRGHLARCISWAGMPGFEAIDDAPVDWLEAARKTRR